MTTLASPQPAPTFFRSLRPATPSPLPIDPVARRLQTLAPELAYGQELQGLLGPTRSYATAAQIVTEGDPAIAPRAVRSGWACLVRLFRDGRRQIQHLLVPGDLLVPLPGMRAPTTVMALTPVTTVQIDAFVANPRAERVLRLDAALTQAALLTQAARLGRQSASERLAHLLLELRDRLRLAGLANEDRYPMPLTQEVLADALGLTSVHVNRTLQSMRRERLIELRGGTVELLDPQRLGRMADYRRPQLVLDTGRSF